MRQAHVYMVSFGKAPYLHNGKRFVVQFCSNSNKTGYAVHKFPKDANLRRQWVKFVQVKRANFVAATEHSAICNIRFSPDCNEESFMVEMGLIKQSAQLSGAVPTIQSPGATKSPGRVLRILFTAQDGSATRTCLPRKAQHQRTSCR